MLQFVILLLVVFMCFYQQRLNLKVPPIEEKLLAKDVKIQRNLGKENDNI